jgi:Co/Zn/Cd efflux system component
VVGSSSALTRTSAGALNVVPSWTRRPILYSPSLSAVNVGVATLLFAYREGDANMRSVWLCSRNDAIGNLAVVGAALGVAGSGTAWPDLAVAALMAALALHGGLAVRRQARAELRAAAASPAAATIGRCNS